MCEDVLELTYSDYRNYNALCALITNNPWYIGNRRVKRDALTKAKKAIMLAEQDYKCAHCGKPLEAEEDRTCEHVIPRRYGSRANERNIIIVDYDCNAIRDDMNHLELVELHYGKIDFSMIEPFSKPMSYEEFNSYNETV